MTSQQFTFELSNITLIMVNAMLGVVLGSLFYSVAKRDSLKLDMRGGYVASVLMMSLGLTAIPLIGTSGLDLLVLYITITCMGFSAIYDLHHHAIYPVSGITAVVAVLRTFTADEMYVILSLYVFFLVASRILKNKLGEGDFEVAFLMLVSSGLLVTLGSVFLASFFGLVAVLSSWVVRRFKGESMPLKGTRIPFVPFLYLGYITAILCASWV